MRQLQENRQALSEKAAQVKAKDQGWKDLNSKPDQVTLVGARLEGNALTDLLGDNGVYSGKATFAGDTVQSMSVESQYDSSFHKKSFRHSRFEDGSELYVAPEGGDGQHRLVLAQPNGTIFIEQTTLADMDQSIDSVLKAGSIAPTDPGAETPGVQGTPWLNLLGDLAKNASLP